MATNAGYTSLTDTYQLIGAGPCLITLEEGVLALARIAASLPANTAAGHSVGSAPGIEPGLSYSGAENVYMKIHPKNVGQPTKVAYTEVV